MIFNSLEFIIFWPIATIGYFLLRQNIRMTFLLGCSAFFYMFFKAEYIIILAATIIIDFALGRLLHETKSNKRKKLYLFLSLGTNLGLLTYFKYANFIISNYNYIVPNAEISYLNIILPIGLSFHVFQSLSYIFEIYYGRISPEKSILRFALYVMFFPQLVAGPIERPQNILHQLRINYSFSVNRAFRGIEIATWGFVKKMVIADNLATVSDYYFNNPNTENSAFTLFAIIAFTFQIYYDFSGYSDIAIGIAKILGIKLMINFKQPYGATSIKAFWDKWHISLSTWFRDYLYIPLGGNRGSKLLWLRNLFLVFIISGLWHGASWNFIIWGAFHGILIISYHFFSKREATKFLFYLPKALGLTFTFINVSIAWIFFRSNTFNDAIFTIKSLFTKVPSVVDFNIQNLTKYFFLLCIFLIVETLFQKRDIKKVFIRHHLLRFGIFIIGLQLIFLFSATDKQHFIYFQF